jgi:hypothetical protein
MVMVKCYRLKNLDYERHKLEDADGLNDLDRVNKELGIRINQDEEVSDLDY